MSDKRNPWIKWYPSDWRADTALRMCSLAARGLWIEMIGMMHEAEPYGHLYVAGKPPSDGQLATLVGVTQKEVSRLLAELEEAGVFSRTEGIIYSRRMVRDKAKQEKDQANGGRGGNPRLKGGVNPPDNTAVDMGDKAQKPEARSHMPDKDKPPPASRSPASKKTQMPPDFGISDRVKAWALENKHGQLEQHLAAFKLSCKAKGYAYVDWDAAFMNAIRQNWAKLTPAAASVPAVRKPDRYDLANIEHEKKYGTPESVKALVAKLTGAPA